MLIFRIKEVRRHKKSPEKERMRIRRGKLRVAIKESMEEILSHCLTIYLFLCIILFFFLCKSFRELDLLIKIIRECQFIGFDDFDGKMILDLVT